MREAAIQHARDVIEATEHLYSEVVPRVAKEIVDDVQACGVSFDINEQLVAAGGRAGPVYKFRDDYPLIDAGDLRPEWDQPDDPQEQMTDDARASENALWYDDDELDAECNDRQRVPGRRGKLRGRCLLPSGRLTSMLCQWRIW